MPPTPTDGAERVWVVNNIYGEVQGPVPIMGVRRPNGWRFPDRPMEVGYRMVVNDTDPEVFVSRSRAETAAHAAGWVRVHLAKAETQVRELRQQLTKLVGGTPDV